MSNHHPIYEEVDRILARILGAIHIALGLAVQIGGPERFPHPNYDPLLEVSNGYVWPYGLGWILGGILMVMPCRIQLRYLGMSIIIILSNVWAALFAVAAYEDVEAALTPTAAYGGYALLNGTLLWLTYIHTRKTNEVD